MKNERNWYVCNCDGNLAGHDLDEAKAKELEQIMQEREPEREWEALQKDN